MRGFAYKTTDDVCHEICRRKQKGFPLSAGALVKGVNRNQALYSNGIRLFGCWRQAIEAAGLDYQKDARAYQPLYPTKDAIISEIQNRKKKGLPLYRAALSSGYDQDGVLFERGVKFFGNWPKALEAAGLDYERDVKKRRSVYPTKESVCAQIQHRKECGLSLNVLSLQKGCIGGEKDGALYSSARALFGSWQNAVEAAGIDYWKEIDRHPGYNTKDAVCQEIQKRSREGLPLYARALRCGSLSERALLGAAYRLWGSWRDALEESGFSYAEIQRVPVYARLSREEIVSRILKRKEQGVPLHFSSVTLGPHRDNLLLSSVRKHFGGWSDAMAAAGLDTTDYARRDRYQDADKVIREVQKRFKEGLPLSVAAMQRGPSKNHGLYVAARKLYGQWEDVIAAAGLDYEKIKHNWFKYPAPESVIEAIQERVRKSMPLNVGSLYAGECPNRALHQSGIRLFGNWPGAVNAAGFDFEPILGKYPDRESVVRKILERVRADLPINSGAVLESDTRNKALYRSGCKKFGRWVYALLMACEEGTTPDYLAMKTVLERMILLEMRRRCKNGFSLVEQDLLGGEKAEAAMVIVSKKIFGSWAGALRAADVAWDGKGLAKYKRNS